ncbi:orotidine 5'-phosphate decarboxylase [Neobacillus bataviensis LMG 21833]|uniref:Orotidine 5'-phosphate decarboxylase n=1 Tax=Neobacillus bataviensis LMG 21833 TaxID=1117379 RepID=K6DZP6_9BACI|nr:orotidine-5'-phosphate decarboxylase [Neobacillus bataviensis]EKN66371.1 orotidine 5'-phosphate decarboxylase [Neobacillus bataviensis LMG 21833]
MNNSLIIALDFAAKSEIERFLKPFEDRKLFVKVGMELFYQEGPGIVHLLKEKGHRIFLDLKLHDIPNTVKSAMKGLARLECDLVNVHAAGGSDMMQAALEGLDAGTAGGRKRPNCIAVTQLTSTSQIQMNNEQLIPVTLNESVLHYASLAKNAGLDGVVCSAWESASIHTQKGDSFFTICPGIRMESDYVGDQKRVATPQFARDAGVSAIVVGRSITRSVDPVKSYEQWMDAWRGVLL